MIKKFVSAILAMALCVGATGTALAATPENTNVQVINRSSKISQQAINELVNDVSASLTYKDGTTVPVETTVVVEDVDSYVAKARGFNENNTYRVTAETKVESDSDNKNDEGVNASVNISLYWQDRLGVNNYFESVEGGISLIKGSIRSSTLHYGGLESGYTMYTKNLGTKKSFDVNVGMYVLTPTASYHVQFDNAIFELNVSVTPSVLD